jgi:hypothetical protein
MSEGCESNDVQMEAYSEAVKSGLYAKKSGLVGKYDNVRKYWEDEITRHFLYPYLCRLIERKRNRMERIRIMDLGCGSADGYELLMGIRYRDADLHDTEIDLLTPDIVGAYKGVDLNEDLLDQARGIYGCNPKVSFQQADFSTGLPIAENEKNYDLYFTSFGTCSHHNEDESLIQLLTDIAKHTDRYSLIVFDWLGRYSYEWQTLWTNDLSKNRNMDYVVSYIYDEEEREERRDELQHLTLRLMSRQEIDAIVQEASKRAGVEIKQSFFFDRSIMTGRHLDTCEYNPHAQPMREAVNSLHEVNLRTNLSDLIFNYVPKDGFDFVNDFFEHLQMCWNILVQYTSELLTLYDEANQVFREPLPEVPATYPGILRAMMERMRRVIEGVGWLGTGLPRENVIEPQLGYALRKLLMTLQTGQGFGHGLVGILEIDKEK